MTGFHVLELDVHATKGISLVNASDKLYDALRLLGAPAQMEKIGYRFPFAFLGVKGGTGHLLMDKTKFLLRIDAALGANGAISDVTTEKTDVTAKVILASAGKK